LREAEVIRVCERNIIPSTGIAQNMSQEEIDYAFGVDRMRYVDKIRQRNE
jgi:hypothetical protein